MFVVKVLRDERAKFDGVCEEEEQPVEEDDAVRVAGPPVLDVLDVEDYAERYKGEDGGPEAEVTEPYVFVVFDL
jgi:hypothetical protein